MNDHGDMTMKKLEDNILSIQQQRDKIQSEIYEEERDLNE